MLRALWFRVESSRVLGFRVLCSVRTEAPVGFFDPLGMSKDGDEKTPLPRLFFKGVVKV